MDSKNKIQAVQDEISKVVIGQEGLIQDILITLLCRGHILLEWYPWLAKTLVVETLAQVVPLSFSRIQFTPDLLPSDLLGWEIYSPKTQDFSMRKWPIFSNIILADEVNRAPAKVQSALLEAMQEKQVSISGTPYPLSQPFMVLATQNPIEQDGTYILPEAQLDRFLLKTLVTYPHVSEEIKIMKQVTGATQKPLTQIISQQDIIEIQKTVENIHVADAIYDYVADIVGYTREWTFEKYLSYGASPRASIALIQTAKAHAFIQGRSFVEPEDIKSMAHGVLRHRIVRNYEAIADDISSDTIIDMILETVSVR